MDRKERGDLLWVRAHLEKALASAAWLRDMGVEEAAELGWSGFRATATPLMPHRHGADRLEICYMTRGSQVHVVNSVTYTLVGGDVLVVLPGDTHGGEGAIQERASFLWLVLRLGPVGRPFLGLRGEMAARIVGVLRGLAGRQFRASPEFIRHMTLLFELAQRRPSDMATPALVLCHTLGVLAELLHGTETVERGV